MANRTPATRSPDFVNHSYDYRPNRTPLSLIIIINHKVFAICYELSFQFFLQLLRISLVSPIFRYSAHILLENALFCRQNVRLKNRLFGSKLFWQNLSKPNYLAYLILLNDIARWRARVAERVKIFTGNWRRGWRSFSGRWRLGGRLAYSFETLGVSSAWDVHGMHPGK